MRWWRMAQNRQCCDGRGWSDAPALGDDAFKPGDLRTNMRDTARGAFRGSRRRLTGHRKTYDATKPIVRQGSQDQKPAGRGTAGQILFLCILSAGILIRGSGYRRRLLGSSGMQAVAVTDPKKRGNNEPEGCNQRLT